MSILTAMEPATTTGQTAQRDAALQQMLGPAPKEARLMANAPAVQNVSLSLGGALADGKLLVAPGPIETPILGRLGLAPDAVKEMAQGLLSRVPVKRFGRPEDIAKAVLYLASPESAYVVGVELNVDGGMSQL